MASWISTEKGLFRRALGLNELGFYYDSHINGTADSLSHTTITVTPEGKRCFAPKNISSAWCTLKAHFPLLAASVQIQNEDSPPQFLVAESRLACLAPGELTFSAIASADEAHAAAFAIASGQRKRELSDELLARIIILSRTDDASTYHVFINLAHLITDGISGGIILKEFLGLLSKPEKRTVPDIEIRLALAVSAESLVPAVKQLSLARQRWRRAAGKIICQLQDSKRTGGHTLPRSFGPIATRLPAQTGWLQALFSPADSLRFIQNCRRHGITVGNALPMLAQVGLARLLCRRYLRGEISSEEWEFRKKQPYHTAGPINLRPFLDKNWYQAGGQSNVSVYVGYFYFTSSFTPLGPAHLAPGDPVPELSQLMSPDRFVLRCNRMKKLAARYLNHPLFFEIGAARLTNKIAMQKSVVAKWEKDPGSFVLPGELEKHNVLPMDQVTYGPVMSHAWSTFGTSAVPREYPVPEAGKPTPPPLFQIQKGEGFLHCRTGELYLGSGTTDGKLFLSIYFDKNVFSEAVVQEWLSETQQAAYFYLGDNVAPASKL